MIEEMPSQKLSKFRCRNCGSYLKEFSGDLYIFDIQFDEDDMEIIKKKSK